jgi:hypothetical protein
MRYRVDQPRQEMAMTSQDPRGAGQSAAESGTGLGPSEAEAIEPEAIEPEAIEPEAIEPEAGETGDAVAGGQAPGPALLLVRAVNTLPPDQREQVLAWLLSRPAGGQGMLPLRLREMSGQLLALQRAGAASSTTQMTAGQQVVPVRFPVDQHAQLRTWCAEHGFSMATVIRGLVSRFLDGQLPERN